MPVICMHTHTHGLVVIVFLYLLSSTHIQYIMPLCIMYILSVTVYTYTYIAAMLCIYIVCDDVCKYIHIRTYIIRVYKNHFKMVQGCRIDTGSCKKPLSKKDSPKTLGTRLSCKTGTGLDGQRARQA